jgi:hypothetical protein
MSLSNDGYSDNRFVLRASVVILHIINEKVRHRRADVAAVFLRRVGACHELAEWCLFYTLYMKKFATDAQMSQMYFGSMSEPALSLSKCG